jgi:hypothetical protein
LAASPHLAGRLAQLAAAVLLLAIAGGRLLATLAAAAGLAAASLLALAARLAALLPALLAILLPTLLLSVGLLRARLAVLRLLPRRAASCWASSFGSSRSSSCSLGQPLELTLQLLGSAHGGAGPRQLPAAFRRALSWRLETRP